MLQTLDESTTARFLVMIHGLNAAGENQRVNSNDDVPVWIESIGPMGDDWIFCMSQYSTNSKTVEISINFLVTTGRQVAPITYRNESTGEKTAAIEPQKDGQHIFRKEFQVELCQTAREWIEAIWAESAKRQTG